MKVNKLSVNDGSTWTNVSDHFSLVSLLIFWLISLFKEGYQTVYVKLKESDDDGSKVSDQFVCSFV